MLQNIMLVAGGVLAGVILVLKVIAPLTKTTADDTVLSKLESLEALLMQVHGVVVPKDPPPPAAGA